MGWHRGEIWFDVDTLWFREVSDGGAAALAANAPSYASLGLEALAAALPDGLAQSRRRRAELRRRREGRKTRFAALVIAPAAMLTLSAPRLGAGSAGGALQEDPPSMTSQRDLAPPQLPTQERAKPSEPVSPRIEWRNATSRGLPYAGSLAGGTQLPIEGADWVTWNPVADRVPNDPDRLYGHERTIRRILSVAAAYRTANPDAPRIVVGDISFRGGGPMELHRSHQSGLDVDVYYPRRDGTERTPTARSQVDHSLAQDLLDLFVAAGAKVVFVGYGTDLKGPRDVVVPYPNHEDHMHVRFRSPG
jgi:murein endopeptidase